MGTVVDACPDPTLVEGVLEHLDADADMETMAKQVERYLGEVLSRM